MRRILALLEACAMLHNMLIDLKEKEREDWIDRDDFSDVDDEERCPPLSPTDVLNLSIPAGAPKDERRQRIMCYLEEHVHF